MPNRLGLGLGMLLACAQACSPAEDDGEPACLITRASGGGDDAPHSYIRMSFDRSTRVLTRESSGDSDFEELDSRSRSLLDASGRTLVFASQVFRGQSFRFDHTFDERGNLLEALGTYTHELELDDAPSGGHYSELRYEHEYDDEGRLRETSLLTPEDGPRWVHMSYQSHDDGRCDSFVAEDKSGPRSTLMFEYEGERWSGQRELLRYGDTDLELQTTVRYDAKGRFRAVEIDGNEHTRMSADGRPDILIDYDYAADGGDTVTVVDYTSDTPDEEVDRDGEPTWAERSVTTHSAQCATLAKQLRRQRESHCQFPVPFLPDLLDR